MGMDERRKEERVKVTTPIYAAVFPGNRAARLYDCSPSGMALLYKGNGDPPLPVQDIYILVQGYVHQLRQGDFDLIHDRRIPSKRSKKNFRKAGIRFRDAYHVGLFAQLSLYALETSPPGNGGLHLQPPVRDRVLTLFRKSLQASAKG